MGRLIKGQGRVVPAAVMEASSEAEAIVAAAFAKADAIRTAAATEAADLRRRAAEEGRQEGLAEVTALLTAAHSEAEAIREASRGTAVALALRVAERVIGTQVAADPALLATLVARAIDDARVKSGSVTVRLHPDDVSRVEGERARLMSRLAARTEVRFVGDAGITRGGCVVESALGVLDARLESQLDAIERALFAGAPNKDGGHG